MRFTGASIRAFGSNPCVRAIGSLPTEQPAASTARRILTAAESAKQTRTSHRGALDRLIGALLENETLERDDVARIVAEPPSGGDGVHPVS